MRFDDQLRRRIALNLSRFEPCFLENVVLAPAAVVIVISRAEECDEACILLIRRASGMGRHAGQFGLPGGRIEGSETPAQAALRELHEELCLSIDEQQVLGSLDDYPTRSGFLIRPVVAWAGDTARVEPNAAEIDEVFRVPLDELLSPDVPRFEASDENELVMSAPLQSLGDSLFAPTAAILYQFREIAFHGRATRVAHLRQPRFAWK